MDMPRELTANGHFRPFDPIYPGIASRATALDAHLKSGDEAQIHEVLGDRMVQLQFTNDGAVSDAEIGKWPLLGGPLPLASEYEVENHFQFHFYSNPFRATGNDQSHTYL